LTACCSVLERFVLQLDSARRQRGVGDDGGRVLVAAQEAAFGAGGLQVLQAFERLDQRAVQVGRLLHVGAHRAAQRALDGPGQAHDERHRQHQHPAQRAADDKRHADEDEQEGQIRQRRQRGAGEELAHHLDLRQVVRIGAR
jgi:hypothetical protein